MTNDADDQLAKTIERETAYCGGIAARINETRFANGGRRYGVVFRREVGDLSLEGTFSMSLGQEELLELVTVAMQAYFAIDDLRRKRTQTCECRANQLTFDQLDAHQGWELDDREIFPSQIEP